MRAPLLVVPVLALLAACGPGKPPVQQNLGKTAPDAAVPLAEGCLPTFGEAQTQGVCDPAASTMSCQYAEGSCYCGLPPVCSGVELPPPDPAEPRVWVCAEKPPDFRDDGCPGVEPSGACWEEDKKCSYGDCCFRELTCQDGGWTMTGGGCPP